LAIEAVILSLLIKDSVAFPIDELEASLHPDLFVYFLLSFLINSKNSQIIATTHNREILNNKDIFRNDAIWITDKSETCATELYSLADFDTSVIRDTSNIYNAYKIGKLGGVPNLGDYFIDSDNETK
jgi:AAA15 family ATPase/GTPase